MNQTVETPIHWLGEFQVDQDVIQGEIIYNKQDGKIFLQIIKKADLSKRPHSKIFHIAGVFNTGTKVVLYHNTLIKDYIREFIYEEIVYRVDYLVCGEPREKFHRLICTIKNGLLWSGISQVNVPEIGNIQFDQSKCEIYHWFEAKITFYTQLKTDFYRIPRKEESITVERLSFEIESDEEQNVEYFINIRDKILSLISFGIKDNVNIEQQWLKNFTGLDTEQQCYNRNQLISSEPAISILNISDCDYNFTLNQIPKNKNTQEKLDKLVPVFNLYSSLFKYSNMPIEMVFLNIVQAIETFHARFFYDDNKKIYMEAIERRFPENDANKLQREMLLSDTQVNKSSNIILASRINDLLVSAKNDLFSKWWKNNPQYTQKIVDTRHYYTHYGKNKEKKALRGDELLQAIYWMRLLLEYHVCSILEIDIEENIHRYIGRLI